MPRVYVRKRENKYLLEDLKKAVDDVKEKRKTYREAEDAYGVPISVIYHRIKGRKIDIEKMRAGVSKVLADNVETHIVSCLKTRAEMGYPVQKEELKQLVKEYVEVSALKTPFKNNKPGDDWYISFMKRHPELSLKKPEHLQKARKDARKPCIVYHFYDILFRTVHDNALNEKPMYIFNADESGFQNDPSRLRGIGEKGKPLSRVSGGSGRESTSALACVSADGQFLPPLIVFKGAAVQARWTSENALEGTLYAATKNGWMEEPVFFNWFTKCFIPFVNKVREDRNEPNHKALLICDGHTSHISIRIVEAADNANIILVKFPSHLTDRLQPLDKSVFGPVKTLWEKKLVEHGIKQMGKGNGRLSRSELSELLGQVWVESFKLENIVSGFSTTDVFPVDASKFPKKMFNLEELKIYETMLQNMSNIISEEIIPISSGDILTEPLPSTSKNELANDVNIEVVNNSSVTSQLEEANYTSDAITYAQKQINIESAQIETQQEQQDTYISDDCYEQRNGDMPIPSSCSEPQSSSYVNIHTTMDENYKVSPLVNQILKLISLDTATNETVKRKIVGCFINSVTTDEEIPSPSKNTLENIFGINKSAQKEKKVVIPRLKQSAFGEILTSDEVKQKLKKAEEEKLKKQSKKRGSNIQETNKKKGKKLSSSGAIDKPKKTRMEEIAKECSSSEDELIVPYAESEDSEYDIENDQELHDEYEEPLQMNPECGNFVLVNFKGGKRLTTVYKYVCIVDEVDEDEGELKVTCLKCMDNTKVLFSLRENDTSYVSFEDIIGVLREPTINMRGERMYYKFPKPLDVFEKP